MSGLRLRRTQGSMRAIHIRKIRVIGSFFFRTTDRADFWSSLLDVRGSSSASSFFCMAQRQYRSSGSA